MESHVAPQAITELISALQTQLSKTDLLPYEETQLRVQLADILLHYSNDVAAAKKHLERAVRVGLAKIFVLRI